MKYYDSTLAGKPHDTKNTVGVIPALGYRNQVNQSLIALIWSQEMGKYKERFYSKLTKWDERKINRHYVSGYNPITKYVYQFYGCAKCFD